MANATQHTSTATSTGSVDQFDAIIIGAGLTGLYQL
jgi:cation diffusion facilitator CzcD-associated flavoprotein CzcO